MNLEPVTATTGAVITLTTDQARELYSALYRMSSELGISAPGRRGEIPWAAPLFELYDLLYEKGFCP